MFIADYYCVGNNNNSKVQGGIQSAQLFALIRAVTLM